MLVSLLQSYIYGPSINLMMTAAQNWMMNHPTKNLHVHLLYFFSPDSFIIMWSRNLNG